MQIPIKIAEHSLEVPGGRLHAKTWCPEHRAHPPLILLHDSLGSVETWREFPLRLAEKTNRLVLAYDRLGFGHSSASMAPPPWDFIRKEGETFLTHIFRFLRNEFHEEVVSLFGHSVGGAMALLAAAAHPDRVERVITESAQAFIEERTLEGIRHAKTEFTDPKNFAKLTKYHGEKAKWVLAAWTEIWLSETFSGWSLKGDLSKQELSLVCPVLAIHGELDEFGSTEFPKTIATLTSGPARIEIFTKVGHVPHRDRPQDVLDLISEFCSE